MAGRFGAGTLILKVVFVINDFRLAHRPLQPWLTFHEVAERLAAKGHDVHLVTDVVSGAEGKVSYTLHESVSLRGREKSGLAAVLAKLSPDAVVTTVTPLGLLAGPWSSIRGARVLGYASYAFYRAAEYWRARRWLPVSELWQYVRHLGVPRPLLRHAFCAGFHALVAQSPATASRLGNLLGPGARPQVVHIPAGIDKAAWTYDGEVPARTGTEFLYLGSTKPIRGYEVLLEAMGLLEERAPRLTVLARAADEAQVRELRADIRRRGLASCVEIEGGWMSVGALRDRIARATAVVLPFVLVPSELPVSVLEVLAVGTPVIVTRVAGLESVVGQGGIAVGPGSSQELAEAMARVAANHQERDALREGAAAVGRSVSSWDEVACRWEALLGG